MTAISFEDVSSDGWSRRRPQFRETASRLAVIGGIAIIVVSAGLTAATHFASASLQPADSVAEASAEVAAMPAASAIRDSVATASPETHATEKADRLAVAPGGDGAATAADARQGRLVHRAALIDHRRFASIASKFEGVKMADSARFMLAPSAGTDQLRSALTERAARDYTRFMMASAPEPAGAPADAAEAPLVQTARLEDMPRPSARPLIEEAAAAAAQMALEAQAATAGMPTAIPLPTARPHVAEQKLQQLASLEPENNALASDVLPGIDLPQSAPVPRSRPAVAKRTAAPERAAAPRRAAAPAAPARGASAPAQALAYAAPEAPAEDSGGGLFGGLGKLFGGNGGSQLPGPGSGIAVYDIAAATVYMPNGQKLEAHSGLGHMQDNPRYVSYKNKGPTPPNVYNLVMRESLFHGVQAVRLLPADGKKKFNRDGLLAHTYMYRSGDSSQSNGCVVFKNYAKFLQAFKRGHVTRMIVVPNMDKLPTYMASL